MVSKLEPKIAKSEAVVVMNMRLSPVKSHRVPILKDFQQGKNGKDEGGQNGPSGRNVQ